jgi:hypothetical protein
MADQSPTITPARATRLRAAGLEIEALSDTLKAQVALLDDDELTVLASVKAKLNAGLDGTARTAAGNVGGFIW